MCFTGFNELIGKQFRMLASKSDYTQRQNFVVTTSLFLNLTLIIISNIQTLLLAW